MNTTLRKIVARSRPHPSDMHFGRVTYNPHHDEVSLNKGLLKATHTGRPPVTSPKSLRVPTSMRHLSVPNHREIGSVGRIVTPKFKFRAHKFL